MQAIQASSKIFFACFTSSDRALAADHENLLFSLSKCFLPVEKYEVLRTCRFSTKTQLFRNVQNLLLRSFFQLLKIIYPDSESKAEYKQVVESIPDQGGKARLRYFKIFLKYEGGDTKQVLGTTRE